MAKKNNIPLPDGSSIELPAWASESTLLAMAKQLQRTNILSDTMLGGVKELKEVDSEVLASVKAVVEAAGTNSESTEKNQKTFLDKTVGTAGAINQAATFFGNAEKPLSSMVGAVDSLAGKLKGPGGGGGLKELMNKSKGLSGFFEKFGGTMSTVTDVALAWVGWNAAKFEQFAEVQKKMIDSGAIFYSSASEFDDLYSDSMKAGITYNAFSDTVTNFGGTMTALGSDVSGGSKKFLSMFKKLSDSTDKLGDLGLSNTELMTQYASYIETQRLTGAIDMKVAGMGTKLDKGFQDLVVESTAMASLTSLTRSDALQRQMSAISGTFEMAGLQGLRDNGKNEQASAAKHILQQLSLISDQGAGGSMIQELSTALGEKLFQYTGNIENFEFDSNLSPETRAAFTKVMGQDFFGNIERMIQTGEMRGEEAGNYILQSFANMNMDKMANAGAVDNSILQAIAQLQSSGILIKKNFGKYAELSADEIEALNKDTKTKLAASGSTVQAMNDASKMFLSAQNAITLDLNNLSVKVESVSNWFNENSDMIKKKSTNFFNEEIVKTEIGTTALPEDTAKDTAQDNNPNKPMKISETTPKVSPVLAVPKDIPKSKELSILKDRLTEKQQSSTIVKHPRDKTRLNKEMALLKRQIAALQKQIKAEEDAVLERALKERNNNFR